MEYVVSLLCVAAATLVIAVLLLKLPPALYGYYIQCNAVRALPGWPTHWLWGNLHQINLDEETTKKWTNFIFQNKHKLTRSWLGPFFPMVAIQHCSLVGPVLKASKDSEVYGLIKPWLGDGLLISGGSKWFRNRRLLTPAFHYDILKGYVGIYNDCTEVLLDKWSVSPAEGGQSVKLFDSIGLLSLDVIMQCAFSFQSNCQTATTAHPYIRTVQDLVELTATRFTSPLKRIDILYYLTSEGRQFRDACNKAHQYSEGVIKERKEFLGLDSGEKVLKREELLAKTRQKRHLDFLDILLTAEDETGEGLTDLEIRDEVDTFMFEGHDTTTSGMCWTLYCLAKHPEAQEKVREEVRSVLQGRDTLDYDDLKELKYTQWAIKEAMRLYPPVFFIFRQSDGNLVLDGHEIPKGMTVGLSIRQIHRHPDTWDNPDEYDPLRFHPSNCEGRDPYAYIPFSGGQRNCIGQNFALNEERIVTASIVNRFKLSLVQGHKVETVPKVVLRSKNDILVNIESAL
ncbi:cytochrome P450 4F6-like [Halichondria panicea]|uniref:cytochrome P450 4F6-like n=1 Tax=Halichondria panicea TaxID=6063 RepID=UPI00312B3710